MPSARSFPVKVERPLPTFLVEGEAKRLLAATDDDETPEGLRARAIMELLYSCGVRLAELHGMNLGDVHHGRREILVRGKGDKERWVLYGDEATEALDQYLSDSRPQLAGSSETDAPLFVNRYGKRLSRRSIQKVVSDYAARAGLKEGIHPHTLRHSFASHMLEGGRRFAGHPGIVGTQQRVNDAALYPHHQAGSPARLHGLPPAGDSGGRRACCR